MSINTICSVLLMSHGTDVFRLESAEHVLEINALLNKSETKFGIIFNDLLNHFKEIHLK